MAYNVKQRSVLFSVHPVCFWHFYYFLAGATQNTKDLWAMVLDLQKKEREAGGVLDMDTKVVNTIKGNTSVVADDTSAAISIRKTCNDMCGTASSHFSIVCIEAACIMCFPVCGEKFADFRVYFVAVVRGPLWY